MKEITLQNNNSEIHFTPYGASIMKWIIKDTKLGEIDVVLGMEHQEDYKADHPSLGSIVGRCANRINNASFTLDGSKYQLEKNIGPHHLHGGSHNYAFKKWELVALSEQECTFTYTSPHLEGNYPGNLKIEVKYHLADDSTLLITYKATSDQDTIVNLTNHTYFNLNGHGHDSILGHKFQVLASHFTPTDENSIPTGVIQSVNDTPMDLRFAKDLTKVDFNASPFLHTKGHDHNYILNCKKFGLASIVSAEESELILECATDQLGLQLYLGNWLQGTQGKENLVYQDYQGFCLEAQAFPDSINNSHFSNVLLKKDSVYRQKTTYKIFRR